MLLYTTACGVLSSIVRFFLDSAKVEEIAVAQDLALLDGVTTNPTHVAAAGRPPAELYPEICKMVKGPVSLEVVSLERAEILKEARALASIADNVVVKIPVTPEGIAAVRRLTSEGIQTNVTAVYSLVQALMAAKCGATYISPFVGRLDEVGHEGIRLVEDIRTVLDRYGFSSQIIFAAVRTPLHVQRAALVGSDVCTMRLSVLQQLYAHPLTDATIEKFLKDWEKVPQ